MGPEALMVRSRTDARVDLAEFTRLEYAGCDGRALEGWVRSEMESRPDERAVTQRLRRWGKRLLRRYDGKPAGRAVRHGIAADASAEGLVAARPLSGTTLAAMPASLGGVGPEGKAAPIAAVPVLARA